MVAQSSAATHTLATYRALTATSRTPVSLCSLYTHALMHSTVQQGEYRPAVTNYTKALAVDPADDANCAKLLCNRAAAWMHLNRYNEAVKDCTDAINRVPEHTKVPSL
jgi:tetratricopeptide (TPR) repeat protein